MRFRWVILLLIAIQPVWLVGALPQSAPAQMPGADCCAQDGCCLTAYCCCESPADQDQPAPGPATPAPERTRLIHHFADPCPLPIVSSDDPATPACRETTDPSDLQPTPVAHRLAILCLWLT